MGVIWWGTVGGGGAGRHVPRFLAVGGTEYLNFWDEKKHVFQYLYVIYLNLKWFTTTTAYIIIVNIHKGRPKY